MALKVDGVSKKLGTFALTDVNLEVAESEYFVLLGPTGAGKTVLLETIMGFHRPEKGRVFLNGRDITDVPTEKRGLGYVPQNCPLFPHMTVSENVEFGLKMRRKASAERKQNVHKMLTLVGLEGMEERTPEALSSGERQKIVLARVLATEPKIVLLDEPLASIDAEATRALRKELKRINHELGVAVVHVTHDQIEAFSLADKLAIIREGRIVQEGRPNEVLLNPADEFVARFLGYENVFHVKLVKIEKETSEVSVDGVTIRLAGTLESQEATVAIRPENILIATKPFPVVDGWNVFKGNIEGYTNLGPFVEVTVDAGVLLKAFVDKRTFLDANLSDGKRVNVGFKTDSVKVVSIQ